MKRQLSIIVDANLLPGAWRFYNRRTFIGAKWAHDHKISMLLAVLTGLGAPGHILVEVGHCIDTGPFFFYYAQQGLRVSYISADDSPPRFDADIEFDEVTFGVPQRKTSQFTPSPWQGVQSFAFYCQDPSNVPVCWLK